MATTTQQPTDVDDGAVTGSRAASGVLRHWPVALGLLATAGMLAGGADREQVTTAVLVACACYAGAAATGRPWVAWAAIPAASVVIAVAEVVGVPRWSALAVGTAVVVLAGLAVAARRPLVTRQAVGLLVYGAVAVTALVVAPTAGLVVGGLGLAAHGLWDLWHLRRGEVVSRSLAVCCLALDVPLGLATVALAVV